MEYLNVYQPIADYLGISVEIAMALMAVIIVWETVWKGIALWKSAKKNHLVWFVAILLFNTVGILPILYVYIFSKIDLKDGKISSKDKKLKKKK